MPEVLLRSDQEGQAAPPQAGAGELRHVWDGRFGIILIEVIGDDVYVNGQRVEPHVR